MLFRSVDIFTKDFEKYEIDLKITELNSPLLVDEKKLDTLDLKITADDKQIVALSPHFKYKKTKELTTIDLMGLNVELNADDETSNDEDVPTQIFGYNSALMIPKYKITLPFKYYNAKLASRNIEFDGKLTQGEITLKSTNSEFSLHVENSSDQVLNKLLNKNIFEGGTFNLDINGKDSTNLSGHFHFNQTQCESKEISGMKNCGRTTNIFG